MPISAEINKSLLHCPLEGTRTVRRSHRTLVGDFNIGGLKALSDAEDAFLNLAAGGAAETALVCNHSKK